MLTLRDLQSSETFVVHPEGAVIGREGGENDIPVRDKSVSKKHAKLYEKGGKWFVEDLQSANGTYIDDRRITKATPVQVGSAFSLSNYQFEVVEIGGDTFGDMAQPATRVGARPAMDDADGGEWAPEETAPPKASKTAPKSPMPKRPAGSGSAKLGAPRGGGGASDEIPQKGVGEVLAIMPKAIAYYMAAVPLLLVNPVGTVRKSIEDQKFDAMGPMELIAWALPAGIFGWAVGVVLTVLTGIVGMIRAFNGSAVVNLLVGTIVGGVVGLVIVVVVAIVSGFLFHPVLGWIIRFLKGDSDAVSRSNYFVLLQTATIISTMGSALGGFLFALICLIPVGIVIKIGGVIPPLVGVVGSVLTIYAAWQWMKFFQVVKWFQIVLMVLIPLSALGGVMGAISALTAKTGTGMVATGGMTGTGGTGMTGMTGTPAATPKNVKATPAPTATAMAGSGDDDDDDAAGDDDDSATPQKTPAPTATPVKVASGGGYGAFVMKRDAVEKAISDDPTILKRDKLLEQYYRQYHRDVAAVKKAHPIRNQAEAPVEQRLIEAEIYERTAKTVDALYSRIPKK